MSPCVSAPRLKSDEDLSASTDLLGAGVAYNLMLAQPTLTEAEAICHQLDAVCFEPSQLSCKMAMQGI